VDSALADLLLEAEIGKIADPVPGDPPGLRRYRLSPSSLQRAAAAGWTLTDLDHWFLTRSGESLSPVGRLFATAATLPSPTTERRTLLRVASETIADGLMQWPVTRSLIAERVGPTALIITEDNLPPLRDALAEIGIPLS
jgi:hypothetical protein